MRLQLGGGELRKARASVRSRPDIGRVLVAVRLGHEPFVFGSWPPAPNREPVIAWGAHVDHTKGISRAHSCGWELSRRRAPDDQAVTRAKKEAGYPSKRNEIKLSLTAN